MREHTFTIRFLVPGRTLEDLSIDLYDLIDDASLEGPDHDGSFLYEFDRHASCLSDALSMALSELRSHLPEVTVIRVHEYDLLTLGDIAGRSGRTTESVRLLMHGKRGPGAFPPAAGDLGGRSKVWRLAEVAQWFEDVLGEPLPDTADSAFLQAFNDALDIRRLVGRLGEPQRRAVASALPDGLIAA
jgi:predicted DNA-binding transcriptional regulator AlpA